MKFPANAVIFMDDSHSVQPIVRIELFFFLIKLKLTYNSSILLLASIISLQMTMFSTKEDRLCSMTTDTNMIAIKKAGLS